eukprot:evm.model.scf_3063.1 EVM.evm.TU.scf_3063.1   scf_3063:11636-13248(+)
MPGPGDDPPPADAASTRPGTVVTLLLVLTNATVLLCASAAARKAFVESSLHLAAATLLGILVLVVMGVPLGFAYLTLRGGMWLTGCMANMSPWGETLYNYMMTL